MKKFGVAIIAIIAAVMLGGNVYYTYKASKECRIVLTMARNMENDGSLDRETATNFYRAIAWSRNMMCPWTTLQRLQRLHKTLQRELDEYNRNCDMGGQFEYAIVSKLN